MGKYPINPRGEPSNAFGEEQGLGQSLVVSIDYPEFDKERITNRFEARSRPKVRDIHLSEEGVPDDQLPFCRIAGKPNGATHDLRPGMICATMRGADDPNPIGLFPLTYSPAPMADGTGLLNDVMPPPRSDERKSQYRYSGGKHPVDVKTTRDALDPPDQPWACVDPRKEGKGNDPITQACDKPNHWDARAAKSLKIEVA